MVKQVVWTKRAIIRFDEIVNYLEDEVSEESANKFVNNVYSLIDKLKKYPEIGRRSRRRKTVRQYRIDKYRKLYYRKYGKKLIIVYVFDDRWNPMTNPF